MTVIIPSQAMEADLNHHMIFYTKGEQCQCELMSFINKCCNTDWDCIYSQTYYFSVMLWRSEVAQLNDLLASWRVSITRLLVMIPVDVLCQAG